MKADLVQTVTVTFEGHAQQTEAGVEFWLARDLQHLLGYAKWDNFLNVVSRAKTACNVSGHQVANHFADVGKMVDLGSGSQREVDDIMLTRYACYLVAQNGDPKKPEIAFAQNYFAIQRRRAELIEHRMLEAERVSARKKLTMTEKELSDVIYQQTGGNDNFALIRSKGDVALVGKSTQAMKAQWKVPDTRPLADFAPTIILKAKDFAAEITIFNSRQHGMKTESAISSENIANNQAVIPTCIKIDRWNIASGGRGAAPWRRRLKPMAPLRKPAGGGASRPPSFSIRLLNRFQGLVLGGVLGAAPLTFRESRSILVGIRHTLIGRGGTGCYFGPGGAFV